MTESAVDHDMPRESISYFSSSTSFTFPSTHQSIVFYLKQTVRFWKSWNVFLHWSLESWLTKSGKSSSSVEVSWYSNWTFAEATFLNSSIKLWMGFWVILRWSNFWLFPSDRKIDELTCKKVRLMFLGCQFSNWLVFKAIGLNSFDKICIEIFLVKFGLCVKTICCLFDKFFIRHIDGKYRSATGPLVYHLPRFFEGQLSVSNSLSQGKVYSYLVIFWESLCWFRVNTKTLLFDFCGTTVKFPSFSSSQVPVHSKE